MSLHVFVCNDAGGKHPIKRKYSGGIGLVSIADQALSARAALLSKPESRASQH